MRENLYFTVTMKNDMMKKSIIITALLCIVSMLVIDKSDTAYNGIWIPIAGLGIVSITAVILLVKKRFSVETAVILLFALGFIIRLYYVSYTTLTPDVFVRQHDLRAFGTGEGHSAYIGFFADNGKFSSNFRFLKPVLPLQKYNFYRWPHFFFVLFLFNNTVKQTYCLSRQILFASVSPNAGNGGRFESRER